MNAEQVVEKILSDARSQADKIAAEASEKASTQESEMQSKLAIFRKESATLAENAANDRKLQMLATARMSVQRQQLTVKAKLLDEVFVQAREQIANMPDDQYKELISSLMEKAVETGDELVLIGKDEKRIDNSLIKQINRKLGPGFKGNLSLSPESANISGGFILRRGKIQINVSTDVLLGQVREEIEMELAKSLFA
jgi:V/A-type H+-transporting ATPase subunit E